MTPQQELELREQIESARQSGNVQVELNLRESLERGQALEQPQEPAPVEGEVLPGLPTLPMGSRRIDPEMITRLPGSLYNVAKQTVGALMSPRETLETLGRTIESGVEAVNPFMTQEEREASPNRPYGEAFVRTMADRFGTPEAASRTFAQDPAGALMDVSGATTLAGGLTRTPALVRAGVGMDPLNVAMNLPKAAAAGLTPRGAPASMYESAVKFPPAQVPREVRERAVETALSERVMPTYAGIDKINDMLGDLDVRINDLINTADKSGKTISRRALYSELSELRQQLRQGAAAPENMRKYTKVVKDLDELMKGGPERLTPSRVQKFKTQTYKDINWRAKPGAKSETMKALARGARKAIEDVTPEIADVNLRYGPLAELRDLLPQPAHRISNRQPVSLTTPLTTTAGGVVGGPAGAAIGAGLGVTQNPRVMAAMALGLRGLQEQGGLGALMSGTPAGEIIRQGLFQTGRLEDMMR